MRRRLPVLSLLLAAQLGSSCMPLIDLDREEKDFEPGHTLAVSVIAPSTDTTVAQGAVIKIEWTAANLTGASAVATVLVRDRSDRSETILAGGVRLSESGTSQSVDWDTSGFETGRYNAVVRVAAGGQSDENVSAGIVTINAAPSFEFTEPLTAASIDITDEDDENDSVTIRWSAFDADGDATLEIGLDPDLDHESGNEILLVSGRDVPASSGFDSLEFTGEDSGGDLVESGTYQYYAKLEDDVNGTSLVNGLALITLVAPAPDDGELAVTQPEEDIEFLAGGDPLKIEFTLAESEDVLVDLKIDTDDNHQNGNERTILSQRLVDADTNEDSFDWDGNESGGTAAPDGIYRVFITVSRAEGNPSTEQAEGLIFRRSVAEKPLIGMLAPAADQTVMAGSFVSVRWRDDDPSETATIALAIDDDMNPQEATETDDAEMEILSARVASGDGVQDTFSFQVPATLAPGTYFIFGYIDRDGAAPFEQSSVAAGRIIIRDPNMN